MEKFQEWFYSLPIWTETDNYLYFIMAILLTLLLDLDPKTKDAPIIAIGTALIVKGKGNGQSS